MYLGILKALLHCILASVLQFKNLMLFWFLITYMLTFFLILGFWFFSHCHRCALKNWCPFKSGILSYSFLKIFLYFLVDIFFPFCLNSVFLFGTTVIQMFNLLDTFSKRFIFFFHIFLFPSSIFWEISLSFSSTFSLRFWFLLASLLVFKSSFLYFVLFISFSSWFMKNYSLFTI